MLSEAVRREAADGRIVAVRLRLQEDDEGAGGDDRTDDLSSDVPGGVLPGEAPGGAEPERHGRIQVASGHVTEAVGAPEHREAKGERDPEKTALPHPPNTRTKVPTNSATSFRMRVMRRPGATPVNPRACRLPERAL